MHKQMVADCAHTSSNVKIHGLGLFCVPKSFSGRPHICGNENTLMRNIVGLVEASALCGSVTNVTTKGLPDSFHAL